MESSLSNYFRCPEQLVNVVCEDSSSQQPGYFRFGEDVTLFGRLNGRVASSLASGNLYDCLLYTSPSPRDRSLSRMPSSA